MWAYAGKGKTMTSISIFNSEAKRIEEIADEYDICDASVIEVLFEIVDCNDIDIAEYI